MEATTYAECHRQWQNAPEWEDDEEGILGVSFEGLLYRSSKGFTWNVQAALTAEGTQDILIDSLIRTASTRYYAIIKGQLYGLNPCSGVLTYHVNLTLDKHIIRDLVGFCSSSWLHQKHSEQLFCVVKRGKGILLAAAFH